MFCDGCSRRGHGAASRQLAGVAAGLAGAGVGAQHGGAGPGCSRRAPRAGRHQSIWCASTTSKRPWLGLCLCHLWACRGIRCYHGLFHQDPTSLCYIKSLSVQFHNRSAGARCPAKLGLHQNAHGQPDTMRHAMLGRCKRICPQPTHNCSSRMQHQAASGSFLVQALLMGTVEVPRGAAPTLQRQLLGM